MSKPYMCGDERPVYIPGDGCECNYTIREVATDEYAASYELLLDGEQVGDIINIPKDKVIKTVTKEICGADDNPYIGAKEGDTYLIVTIENSDEVIYVPLDDVAYSHNYYTKDEVDAMIAAIIAGELATVFPVGSEYITSTNNTPAPHLGGAWSLIGKAYEEAELVNAGVTWNTTNTNNGALSFKSLIMRKDGAVKVALQFVNKIAFDETERILCSIPFSSLGITSIDYPHRVSFVVASDYCNSVGVIDCSENNNNLVISITDVVTDNSSGAAQAGGTWRGSFVLLPTTGMMDDSACDRFYWVKDSN